MNFDLNEEKIKKTKKDNKNSSKKKINNNKTKTKLKLTKTTIVNNKVELNKKRDFTSFVGSILVAVLYIFTIIVYLLIISIKNKNGLFNYFAIIFFSIIVGFFYLYLQDKYDNSIKYRIKSISTFSHFTGIIIFTFIKTINYFIELFNSTNVNPVNSSILNMISLNPYLITIFVIIGLNIANILTLIVEKKYKTILYIIIPVGISLIIGNLFFSLFI